MTLLSSVLVVAKKELRAYFNSPLAYIFLDVFLVVNAWLFFQTYFLYGQANMRSFFSFLPWMFLFLIPSITMRLWSEEKKLGTIEILLTLPVSDLGIVLGKFFASFCFLGLSLILSFMIPVIVLYTGPADLGVIISSYIGSLLLGSAYLALGLWVSAKTDNQIIAFILTVVVCFAFFIVSSDFVLGGLPGFLAPVFQFAGLSSHFNSISRGVLDSRDLFYYLSFIGFFLYLNTLTITGRRLD